VPPDGPEVFVPLAYVLPDVDGARFALAGLSTAAGETYLRVVSSGTPEAPEPADWCALERECRMFSKNHRYGLVSKPCSCSRRG
jgi:hypothetical protein